MSAYDTKEAVAELVKPEYVPNLVIRVSNNELSPKKKHALTRKLTTKAPSLPR